MVACTIARQPSLEALKKFMAPHASRSSSCARYARRAAVTAAELIEVYHCLPAVQACCLRAWSQLAAQGGKEICDYITNKLGGIGKTLNALRAHPELSDMQEAGCGTLAYVARFSPSAREE